MKKGNAGLRTVRGGFVEATAVVNKDTDGSNPSLGSRSLRPDGSSSPSSSVGLDAGAVCTGVLWTKTAEAAIGFALSNLEATEFN